MKENVVRTGKTMFWVLFICLMASVAIAQEKSTVPSEVTALTPGQVVIGGNVTTGMPLSKTMMLLGIPAQIKVVRGASNDRDSIEINYANHGLIIRAMSMGSTVEGIEVGPSFKGTFKAENTIKLGVKYEMLISEYGLPTSLTAQVMRYPTRGLYFQLNNNRLLSAKTYRNGTKLMDAKLMNP
jgi:hypothetical protein